MLIRITVVKEFLFIVSAFSYQPCRDFGKALWTSMKLKVKNNKQQAIDFFFFNLYHVFLCFQICVICYLHGLRGGKKSFGAVDRLCALYTSL